MSRVPKVVVAGHKSLLAQPKCTAQWRCPPVQIPYPVPAAREHACAPPPLFSASCPMILLPSPNLLLD